MVIFRSRCASERKFATSSSLSSAFKNHAEIASFLSKPSWSVSSLLPTPAQTEAEDSVTAKQLQHLLRLSALPPPSSSEEEAKMLRDLKAQLHFVKAIQAVDTTGVEPMQAIRDQTARAKEENVITLESMREALANEEVVGRHHRRIRRRQGDVSDAKAVEDWDVLGQAKKRVGRYFVVESGAAEGSG
jgi:aspartyl/glutamyl-tRNA(Asn/Gln) amidotransferase C subunit